MNSTPVVSPLLSVGRIIRTRMERSLPLPFGQCEVLRVVADGKAPSMHDIASHFKISAPSATSIVQYLVREKYVERTGNPRDRREVHLSLTPKGRRIHARISRIRARILAEILSVLGKKDMEDLRRILIKIINHRSV